MDERVRRAAEACGFLGGALVSAKPFEVWGKAVPARENPFYGQMTDDPKTLMPEVRSLLVLAMPYAFYKGWPIKVPQVSAYYLKAQDAYHAGAQLAQMLLEMGIKAQTAPALPHKAAAYRAGWRQGRNGLSMHPEFGSRMALSLLATDLPPEKADGEEGGLSACCAQCRACARACPVGALPGDGSVDETRCLRAHMLARSPVPLSLRAKMRFRLLGCEDCLRACPQNRGECTPAPPELTGHFELEKLLSGDIHPLKPLIGPNYARKGKLAAQAILAAANMGREDLLPMIRQHAHGGQEALEEHARWAAAKLSGGAYAGV